MGQVGFEALAMLCFVFLASCSCVAWAFLRNREAFFFFSFFVSSTPFAYRLGTLRKQRTAEQKNSTAAAAYSIRSPTYLVA